MSCLFDSLVQHTKSHHSKELRNIICDFLQKDPVLIGDDSFSKLLGGKAKMNDYIKNMRKVSTWGSAYEIRAFCEIFQVIVLVRTNDSRYIEFKPCGLKIKHPKKIRLDWNGVHYEPIL
jgi:hypothetical protein